jgi:hypothetical protein
VSLTKCQGAFFSDVSIILSSTDFWSGQSVDDITENEYRGLMTSHVLMTSHEMNNVTNLVSALQNIFASSLTVK